MTTRSGYRWATWGDLNAFFGLMLDNVTNLVLLAAILVFGFGYPAEVLFSHMIPGTAFGVLVGDVLYTWLAFRLAKRTGNRDVTAMPLGLDTPSTIGIAAAVLGPAWLQTRDPILTWQIGMATLVLMGVLKFVLSFFGDQVRRIIPQAGLLGSLAGVGVALLGYLPLLHIFDLPIVGVSALGVLLYSVIARLRLPGNVPGAFAAVLVGVVLYYTLGPAGLLAKFQAPALSLDLAFPVPTLGFLDGLGAAVKYLPIALPFGLLTVVGGINVTESARVAGDRYETRDILLVEAVATLAAGLTGGVAQSTPYIGHPAYKVMGGRAAYTLATGLFIGLGGVLGYVSWFIQLIPPAAAAPILIFIGLEIISQAFVATPRRHVTAVAFALLPVVGELVRIELVTFFADPKMASVALTAKGEHAWTLVRALGNGFIITAMLWGGALAYVIDRRLGTAAILLLVTASLALFGVIHSVGANGEVYLPWAVGSELPVRFAVGYAIFAVFLLLMKVTGLGRPQALDDPAP